MADRVLLEDVAPLSEKDFLAQVREFMGVLGWNHLYHTHDARHSPAGFPDIIALRDGRCIVAELKSDKGKTTPEQRSWLDQWQMIPGVEVHVWRPRDWERLCSEILGTDSR